MANQYLDLKIIECSRLHSEEAKSGNNENYAQWINNLTDIAHLDPGDKISVHGAMVSERGAGQSSSIEIKGTTLGFAKVFNYVDVLRENASGTLPSGYEKISCNASSQEIPIRDDTLTFNLEYYQTMNAHNYIHLPRNWWYNASAASREEQWTNNDSTKAGLNWSHNLIELDKYSLKQDYFVSQPGGVTYNIAERFYKPKNNNDKYTLMMRDNSYYSATSASGNLGGYPGDPDPPNVLPYKASLRRSRDPENTVYHVYKELKQITLPPGFNSPEFISTEITRQLQKINEEKIQSYTLDEEEAEFGLIKSQIPVYRTISTETYKPFNVANIFRSIASEDGDSNDYGVIEKAFKEYMFTGTSNHAGFDYLSQYHIVATKRPELYETGRLINIVGFKDDDPYEPIGNVGIYGSQLQNDWNNDEEYIVINQYYTKENCLLWRDFFLAQEKYPEIWDYMNSETNSYAEGDTIDNSRWTHMNRWSNSYQTYTENGEEAMLGSSHYSFHTWQSSAALQKLPLSSVILPLVYDPLSKDTFVEKADIDVKTPESSRKTSFGCISMNASGFIMFKTTPHNGVNSTLYTALRMPGAAQTANIAKTRKLGFDMHFNAPGMCYVLPYAGYSQYPDSYNSDTGPTAIGDYRISSNSDPWTDTFVDGAQFVNKLYLGADTPQLNFNGTNFTFSNLHTPLNNGNDNRVNNPSLPAALTTEAEAVVYKINPREQLNDWTPARVPIIKNASDVTINTQLEPWRIYDSHAGVYITDFNLTEQEWSGSLWDLLGFTYRQFNTTENTRLDRITNVNVNRLSIITTNADVATGDTKVYVQNPFNTVLYNNMMPITVNDTEAHVNPYVYRPSIAQKTVSVEIIADNLPTRMIRGYYTIRSNILQSAPFIGGYLNNTTMPIIGIVNKVNGYGDFYFGQESSLQFTVTKPLKLASISCSIHDPDGSYANCSEQSTVLFKIEKTVNTTFNVALEFLQDEQQQQQQKK